MTNKTGLNCRQHSYSTVFIYHDESPARLAEDILFRVLLQAGQGWAGGRGRLGRQGGGWGPGRGSLPLEIRCITVDTG